MKFISFPIEHLHLRAVLCPLALVLAGCELTPQAKEGLHPESHRTSTKALPPEKTYLRECETRIERRWLALNDEDDRARRSSRFVWQPAWEVRRFRTRTPIKATFEIVSDGRVENLKFDAVSMPAPEVVGLIREIILETRHPSMPPAVARPTGGRLSTEMWFTEPGEDRSPAMDPGSTPATSGS